MPTTQPGSVEFEIDVVGILTIGAKCERRNERKKGVTVNKSVMAPRVGFEPTTYRLTADRSTAELSGNVQKEANSQGYESLFSSDDCSIWTAPAQ